MNMRRGHPNQVHAARYGNFARVRIGTPGGLNTVGFER